MYMLHNAVFAYLLPLTVISCLITSDSLERNSGVAVPKLLDGI